MVEVTTSWADIEEGGTVWIWRLRLEGLAISERK